MEEDFQTWWNERHFYSTHPLYATFKMLHGQGADLDYVDFLCDNLFMGDFLRSIRRKPMVDKKREILEAFLKTQGDELRIWLRFVATMVVGFAAQAIAKKHLPDEDPLSLLSPQEVKKIVSVSLLYCAGWMSDNQMKKAASSRAQRRQELEHFKSQHGHIPIYRLFLDYNKPIPPKRGNKADPWGTLFLVAVTEHVREKTGKPHYAEAVKLLLKTRAQYEKYWRQRRGRFPRTTKQSALVRVKNFKKVNPSWDEALGLFNDQFRLSSKSKNSDGAKSNTDRPSV